MIADFRDLLAELVASEVRFLVVGAHALAALGVPRVTADLDLWVEPTPANANRIWRALAVGGTLFDVPVAFIGREPFIRNKRASGRPKDLDDLRALGV